MNQPIPTIQKERADILDILRAFALLGICIANAGYFSLYIFQSNVTRDSFSTSTLDKALSYIHVMAIDGKFYTIFSILFGIGFSIIFLRNKAIGRNGLLVFYRRLFILFIIGSCHSLLLWDGDILLFYSIVGILLPLFRNCSDRTLLIWVVVLLLSPLLFDLAKVMTNNKWNLGNPFIKQALLVDAKSGITEKNVDTWIVAHKSYSDLLKWTHSGTWWSWYLRIDSNRIPKVLAMFILGLYIGRKNLYSQLDIYRPLLKKIQLYGFAIGIPAGIAHAYFDFDHKAIPNPLGLLDTLSYALNVTPLALAYMATIALWYQAGKFSSLWSALKPAGRMALTNYIMQSVICVFIYHGIGLGWGGKVGPTSFVAVAIGIFILQVIYSNWWFRYFNYGPLEWIWRMLTYGKYLAIRRK